jgi:hypothetical protein
MDVKQLEQSNRSKYGAKEHDQISTNYRVSKERGDIWCAENVKRYLDRFTRPGSSKGNNMTDLLKAQDYLQRMIEHNERNGNIVNKEIIE